MSPSMSRPDPADRGTTPTPKITFADGGVTRSRISQYRIPEVKPFVETSRAGPESPTLLNWRVPVQLTSTAKHSSTSTSAEGPHPAGFPGSPDPGPPGKPPGSGRGCAPTFIGISPDMVGTGPGGKPRIGVGGPGRADVSIEGAPAYVTTVSEPSSSCPCEGTRTGCGEAERQRALSLMVSCAAPRIGCGVPERVGACPRPM